MTVGEYSEYHHGVEVTPTAAPNLRRVLHYARWRLDMLLHWRHVSRLVQPGDRVAEIGVWMGGSLRRWLRRRPRLMLCVDPYRSVVGPQWEARLSQDEMDALYGSMRRRYRHFPACVWIRKPSIHAALNVADEELNLVYVDGDHRYTAVRQDLLAWWRCVAPGGYLVLDDHLDGRWWGDDVIRAAQDTRLEGESRRYVRGRWLIMQKEEP